MDVELQWPSKQLAHIELHRPERLNALTLGMAHQIVTALDEASSTPGCRVVLLSGAGRAFCAGMDVNAAVEDGLTGGTPAQQLVSQETFASMVSAVRRTRQPVIAAVHGPAVGAGFGLALAADVRLASDTAAFHIGAIRLGLTSAECGISYHLPRLIGTGAAFEIMLTGRPVHAPEALRLGLITSIWTNADLIGASTALADAICDNSPFVVDQTKQAMWRSLELDFDETIAMENRLQILAAGTEDYTEATTAFLEKRPARFVGR